MQFLDASASAGFICYAYVSPSAQAVLAENSFYLAVVLVFSLYSMPTAKLYLICIEIEY